MKQSAVPLDTGTAVSPPTSSAGRAIAAASIGNALEWYDFSVYAFFAVYIARNFFHRGNTGTELVEAFMAFGIGFIARPLGALAIGVYGDRAGRKAALTLTILVMATGTGVIAFGLAMLGEGDVYYRGRKLAAADALKLAGIATIYPYGKDALAILSSNAYSAGMAALALTDMASLARVSKLVFALGLQGLNGNVSPFREDTLALRPFPAALRAGAALRTLLAGSSLWNKDPDRPLQDPLSFRSGVYLLGEEDRTYDEARALLQVQLNSSDDNPGVAVSVAPKSNRAQDAAGYVDGGGAVLPSANFEPLPWVLAFEQLGLALGHNALASAQRIVKLNDSHLSGLSRFLGTEETVHAFGAMEKPPTALAMTIKTLATPVSLDYLPVAGGIEDIATNAPEVVQRVQKQIDASYTLLGLELVEAAQAIDLRRRRQPSFTLAPATQPLYRALRAKVAFLERDRPLTPDFRAADTLLRAYRD